MNDTFEKFLTKQTGYKSNKCKCNECRKQCRTPCLGTPDDILRLIGEGYISQLSETLWCVGMLTGHLKEPVRMVQPTKMENGCIFFKDGLCELHDLGLKPTEGRFSNHAIPKRKQKVSNMLSWNVAMEWLAVKNRPTILKIFLLMPN